MPTRQRREDFRDFILQEHVVAEDRKAVKLFNAAEYKPVESLPHDQPEFWVYDDSNDRRYTRRLQKNVLAVTMSILDYYGGMSLRDREANQGLRIRWLYVFNHLKDSSVEKFRLVFPLATPIPAWGHSRIVRT